MPRQDSRLIPAAAAVLLAVLALPGVADAASQGSKWCGTYDNGLIESLAVHYENQRRLARERAESPAAFAAAAARSGPPVTTAGDVALIEDDGSIIIDRKLFDLSNRGLRLKSKKRTPSLYKIGGLGARIGSDLGDLLPLGDDDSIRVDLPFTFTFYGEKYDRVWVNSDGNLTFTRPDTSSFERDLPRVLNGPPRIAPFFEDYDPSAVSSGGGGTAPGVYVKFPNPKRAIITWYRLPRFGTSNENTFQVEISRNRQIKFRYGRVDGEVGIVAIAPGSGSPLATVDFSEDRGEQFDSAIAERFANTQSVDEPQLAKTFYSVFADDYSHLILFTDFPLILGSGTIAYERNISNDVRGLGLGIFNAGSIYGSQRPLESFVMMGSLNKFTDPDIHKPLFLDDLFSPVDILLHEIAHRWLFFPSVRQNGILDDQLRGRGDAHWSFYAHSEGSLLEGSDLQPRPEGGFITTDAPRKYSAFDLYLMGALDPDDVPPTFVVTGNDADRATAAPEAGRLVLGDRVDVALDAVIRAEGPRSPSAADAPTRFKMAVILLSREGETPSSQSLAMVEELRVALERRFRTLTGRAMRVDTRLVTKPAG